MLNSQELYDFFNNYHEPESFSVMSLKLKALKQFGRPDDIRNAITAAQHAVQYYWGFRGDFITNDDDLENFRFVQINGLKMLTNGRGMYMLNDGRPYYGDCEYCGEPLHHCERPEGEYILTNVPDNAESYEDVLAAAERKHICYDCNLDTNKFLRLYPTSSTVYYGDVQHGNVMEHFYKVFEEGSLIGLHYRYADDGTLNKPGSMFVKENNSFPSGMAEKFILVSDPFMAVDGEPYYVEIKKVSYIYDLSKPDDPFIPVDKTAIDKNAYTFVKGFESVKYRIDAGFRVYVRKDELQEFKQRFKKTYPETDPDEYSAESGECSINRYHSWQHPYKKLVMPFERAQEMLFGIELETEGNADNARYVLPYSAICHMEHDGSLDSSGIEIIFNPMSWAYISANAERISDIFTALRKHHQVSSDSSHCGLHIHASYMALGDTEDERDRVVSRIVAITNGLRSDMEEYARRASNEYASYDERIHAFSKISYDVVKECMNSENRYIAVNCSNSYNDTAYSANEVCVTQNTIEFRLFKGSLNTITVLAAVEMVKHIIEAAMSDCAAVRFEDLINHGDYIPTYIMSRLRYGRYFKDETVYLDYLDLEHVLDEFYNSNISAEEFTAACCAIKAKNHKTNTRQI